MGASDIFKSIGLSLATSFLGGYVSNGFSLGGAENVDNAVAASNASANTLSSLNTPVEFDVPTEFSLADNALATTDTSSFNMGSSIPDTPIPKVEEGGFWSDVGDGLTSPAGMAALLTAGASLASTMLGQQEAEDNREFQSEEAQKNRDTQSSENALNREHSSEQARLTREHALALQKMSQDFSGEQAAKSRRFQAVLSSQNARQNAYSGRTGNIGRGRQLSQNVANINQAILS